MKIVFEKRQKNKPTFTKKWVGRLLRLGCVWITLSYVLAFMDKMQIAESLSSTVASVIIATVSGYLCKAFFETREEKRLEFMREKEFGNEDKLEAEINEP